MTAPTAADARCRGCGVGAGVAGGLVAGAIIGGAIANSQPRYYAPGARLCRVQRLYEPYPATCPGGYWARRPMHDGYGNFVGWSRPRFICP